MKFVFHCCGFVPRIIKLQHSRIPRCVPSTKYFKLYVGTRNYFAASVVYLNGSKQIKHQNSNRCTPKEDIKWTIQHKRRLTMWPQNYLKGNLRCDEIYMQQRNLSSSSDSSSQLKENIWTIPNFLCLSRIALAPVMSYLVINSEHTIALALLGVAGITDLLDGYIARHFKNQSSVFGSMLDPFADKILMTFMTFTLAWVNLMPVPLCALIIGRDIWLVLCVFYLRYKTLPDPLTLSRFFDANLPTVQMKPTFISKVNTGLQLGLVGLCMAAPVFNFVDHSWLQTYWYFVGATTIISGMSYVVKGKETFKILKQR